MCGVSLLLILLFYCVIEGAVSTCLNLVVSHQGRGLIDDPLVVT